MSEYVFIVEIQAGCAGQDNTMLFDSVWSSEEKAKEYCKKFNSTGWAGLGWTYEITKTKLDIGG